jgi:hypothetical protein
VIIADSGNEKQLEQMAKRAKVIVNVVGPVILEIRIVKIKKYFSTDFMARLWLRQLLKMAPLMLTSAGNRRYFNQIK